MSSSTSKKINAVTFIAVLAGCYWFLSNLQRAMYVTWIFVTSHELTPGIPEALIKGLFFDFAAAFYLFAPLALFFLIVPKRFSIKTWFRVGVMVLSLFPLFVVSFSSVGEIFFFDEFHARYNFIAVDYLIYTTEVIRNVLESYNMVVLASGVILPLVLLGFLIRVLLKRLDRTQTSRRQTKWIFTSVVIGAMLCAAFVTEDRLLNDENYWPRELAKNSLFTIFSAYNHNSINYHEFYASLDSTEARKFARQTVQGHYLNDIDMTHEIQSSGTPKKLNVMLLAMESMSAGFLGHFGNKQPITPYLDKLADESLFFTNLYATGTRTVRGLEALTLSLPPTPGQSILRRPHSDNLFTIGTVFAQQGYTTQFVYGGYAYFDNMKEYFESNGFQVVDRSDFPADEIHFGNAWGVCDEDLFTQLLKQQDAIVNSGKNFFQVVLNTSNHRPYTFPDGRIDMASHTGREAAIKYSDYAIGKYIEEAKTKPWFKDTVFIFVADHDASVAGGTDIPVKDFLIPAIFYSPAHIKPEKINNLASQIDISPTLLGLLGWSYKSKFFGEDLRASNPARAYLGTYQKVSRLTPHQLIILSPGKTIESQDLDDQNRPIKTVGAKMKDPASLSEAAKLTIGVYQTASEMFVKGLQKKEQGQ